MKGKRFLGLVISAAMTLTAFSGFAVTSASAEVGDVENNIWTASVDDAGKTADTVLYDGEKGTLTTLFNITLTTETTDSAGVSTPVEETVGERTFNAFASHPTQNGGFNTNGTLRDGYYTLFSFVPKADGVLTVYFLNVGSTKSACIVEDGATDYKTGGALVFQSGSDASMSVSAQLEADKKYYMFVDGSKGRFAAVDYEVGATYEQATPAPATPVPTVDPNSTSWTASELDIGRKAGDLLMGGLTLVSDNSSTNKAYVSASENGKLESDADTGEKVAAGAALKFIAPADGVLSVTMIDLGSENDDGTIKTLTPVIYGVSEKENVFEYTTSGIKETVVMTADVVEGNTYYITATGTKGRFSAASFTPASDVIATDEPDTTDVPVIETDAPSTDAPVQSPDAPIVPSTGGITYENGTITVTADTAAGVLVHAKYDNGALTSVETADLSFTDGTATVEASGLGNTIETGDKLMAWNSLKNMEPICKTFTIGGASTPDNTTAPSETTTPDTTLSPDETTAPDTTLSPSETTAPTDEPDDELPADILWRADDTAFANVLAGNADTVNGLTASEGFGSNNKKVAYTHTDGTEYTFTAQWKHGNAAQTLTFTPEQACIVTVVFNGNGGVGREVNISQNGAVIASGLSTDTATTAAEVVVADIEDPTAGDVVISGGGSNKNISAIFVEYYDPTITVTRNVSGNITYNGNADTTNTKLIFTSTKDNERYEVPFGSTYSVDLRQNRDYDITLETGGEASEDIAVAITTNNVSVAKSDKTFDIIVADIAETKVTGDVVVHDVNNDGTSLDLSNVTLTFTASDIEESDEPLVYTTAISGNELENLVMMPNHEYTVTATGIDGYELSPLSQSYTMVAGDISPFKNILFNETVGDVEFISTIQVGADKAYATISDAITAIKAMTDRPAGEAGRVTVEIDPGTYVEQVIVDAPYVTLKAADSEAAPTANSDGITYGNNVVISFYYGIGYLYYSADGGYYSLDKAVQKTNVGAVTRWGSTVRVTGTNFIAENITFENSLNCRVTPEELADGATSADTGWYSDVAGKPDRTVENYDARTKDATERCAAFAGDGSNYGLYNCEFIGSQDTLYTGNNGYFKNCYIEGGTDYIFGGNSIVFENCTLAWHGYSDQENGGYITACKTSATPTAGTPDLTANGYLLKDCTVANSKYYTANKFAPGAWGRNWGNANCQVVFQNTVIEENVTKPAGWVPMSGASISNSILFVDGVYAEADTQKATDLTVAADNPNGTMTANNYTVMNLTDYFGDWTPVHYTAQ